jgi:hypothetical protein
MTAAATTITVTTSNADQSVSHSCIRSFVDLFITRRPLGNSVDDDDVSKNDKKRFVISHLCNHEQTLTRTTGVVTPDTIEDDCDYDYATGARETLATVV